MNALLEFIIGLVFTFMVFSLVTSWIVEYISLWKQRRARMLKEFVVHALQDRFNKNWGQMVYAHPLIDVLHRHFALPTFWSRLLAGTQLSTKRRLPMYIPSDQFAQALIDVIISSGRQSHFVRDEATGQQMLKPEKLTGLGFQDFLNALDDLQESETKITLASLARPIAPNSANAMQELEAAIARWYEAGMERLTGWYKRETRKWLLGVGLVVAVVMNVNTLSLSKALYNQPTLRTAVAEAATRYVRQNPQLPAANGDSNLRQLLLRIDSVQRSASSLGLPIGWRHRPNPRDYISDFAQAFPNSWLGWLLTAFAISFGAPFWFDVLKQFVNVRSAGVKPKTKK